MCCHGCEAVAEAIVAAGLTDFYRHRTAPSRRAEDLIPEQLRGLALYDRPDLQKSFVRAESEHTREAALILEGIVCAACVWLSERHVNALPGVLEFRVNYSTHRAQVRWDERQTPLSAILAAIAAIGYIAHPFDPNRQEALQKRERGVALRRLAVAGLGSMQVMMLAVGLYVGEHQGMEDWIREFLRWVCLILAAPVVAYSGLPFYTAAWRDLRNRVALLKDAVERTTKKQVAIFCAMAVLALIGLSKDILMAVFWAVCALGYIAFTLGTHIEDIKKSSVSE